MNLKKHQLIYHHSNDVKIDEPCCVANIETNKYAADARLGGDVVLTEQELRATNLFRSGELPRPRLGLNCVGGDSSAEMCKALGRRVKGEESIETQRIFNIYQLYEQSHPSIMNQSMNKRPNPMFTYYV